MLKAILHNKAGRLSVADEDLSWRDVFRQREDLLTATVFGRLRYLSTPVQQKILGFLLSESHVPGEIRHIEFWPRLDVKNVLELKNRRFVEPDIWIRCEHLHVIVEVKPPFGGMQYRDQWAAEILAVNQAKEDSLPIVLVALGNVPSGCCSTQIQVNLIEIPHKVYERNWPSLCYAFFAWLKESEGSDRAIIHDIVSAFELFGLTRPTPPWVDLISLAKAEPLSTALLQTLPLRKSAWGSPRPKNWADLLTYSNEQSLDIEQCKKSLVKMLAIS